MDDYSDKEREEDAASFNRTKRWNLIFTVLAAAILLYNLWTIFYYFSNMNPLIPFNVGFIVMDEEINFTLILLFGFLLALILRWRKYYAIANLCLFFFIFFAYVLKESIGLNELFY